MKRFFTAGVFLGIYIFLVSCVQSITPTTAPIPLSTATIAATITPLPSETPTPTIAPTESLKNIAPTLIPTIDPALVPELLSKAFSIQTLEGINGHSLKQITGWNYGFGTATWYAYCPSYVWLDTTHILLYPGAGQEFPPEGMGAAGINIVPQPVVLNLETGSTWLPPVDVSSERTCNRVFWSRDLGILINSGTYKAEPAVFTHTFDGKKLANYRGKFTQVSPSKEKILIEDNVLIDLRTNSRTTLAWSLENYEDQMLSEVFWTSDETRLYRCCYFYADLNAGTSSRFGTSDFWDAKGNPLEYEGLWLYRGEWVRNDIFFLAKWSWVDDGDIRYLPLFDPAKRTIYDVRRLAGISDELSCLETNVSTSGSYVWAECYEKNYLINLTTFETNEYLIPGYSNADVDWSMDDKFALIQNYDNTSETKQYYVLSLSDKELNTLPGVNPVSIPLWHPIDGVFAYIAEDAQKFELFDAQTMTTRGIPLPSTFKAFLWSADGANLALVAENGSLWQVDYPTLENLEQLTAPLPNISNVNWSPDGNFLSFISGSDIHIVDTTK